MSMWDLSVLFFQLLASLKVFQKLKKKKSELWSKFNSQRHISTKSNGHPQARNGDLCSCGLSWSNRYLKKWKNYCNSTFSCRATTKCILNPKQGRYLHVAETLVVFCCSDMINQIAFYKPSQQANVQTCSLEATWKKIPWTFLLRNATSPTILMAQRTASCGKTWTIPTLSWKVIQNIQVIDVKEF